MKNANLLGFEPENLVVDAKETKIIDQEEIKDDLAIRVPSKRGPVTISDDEKLAALIKWRDRPKHDKTLQDWLVDEFGVDDK